MLCDYGVGFILLRLVDPETSQRACHLFGVLNEVDQCLLVGTPRIVRFEERNGTSNGTLLYVTYYYVSEYGSYDSPRKNTITIIKILKYSFILFMFSITFKKY